MAKVDHYRALLTSLEDWEPFLLAESGLPGPRGNLELARAVADVAEEARFRRWLALDAGQAPANSPEEFLAFCGVLGLGRLLAEGRQDVLPELRQCAADPRWRTREAVAMALQRWGDVDMAALLAAMRDWSRGGRLEQRAAAAGLCEPRLLSRPENAIAVLHILDDITATLPDAGDHKTGEFRILRQALGYCWSVAVVAAPATGKTLMERWLSSADPDTAAGWIMRENLKKKRLARMDPQWVAGCQS